MENSRRNFIKSTAALAAAGAVTAIAATAGAEQKRKSKTAGGGDAALPLVEPGKGMAAGVKYAHVHADVKDASLKTDRQGVKWADQNCAGCMLYTKIDDKIGKCTLFAGQAVKSTGWCNSWAKKA